MADEKNLDEDPTPPKFGSYDEWPDATEDDADFDAPEQNAKGGDNQ